ncbi:MAG: hypothetical protein K2Q25_13715 [Mycobacteriaceae bacterium]|nr:hypothetical protein [Mycobacteriaceae bacterium]
MGLIIRLVELLLVVMPLAGIMVAAIKAFAANNRRGEQAPRLNQLRQPGNLTGAPQPGCADVDRPAQWRSLRRVLAEHHRIDTRWLEYELDVTKLLDFPLMTDMRDPLTINFHKTKLRADFLRPARAEDFLDDGDAVARYQAAVEDYVTAFNAAETEAIRRRRSDFSGAGQQRIARAQNLLRVASDSAATMQERQRAYELAGKELDGLIVLPAAMQASIERGISGELD